MCSTSKHFTVGSSKFTKRISLIEVVGFDCRYSKTAEYKTSAHLSFGKPNIPELIAGIEIEVNFLELATSKQLETQRLKRSDSPLLPPSHTGPTA